MKFEVSHEFVSDQTATRQLASSAQHRHGVGWGKQNKGNYGGWWQDMLHLNVKCIFFGSLTDKKQMKKQIYSIRWDCKWTLFQSWQRGAAWNREDNMCAAKMMANYENYKCHIYSKFHITLKQVSLVLSPQMKCTSVHLKVRLKHGSYSCSSAATGAHFYNKIQNVFYN